jgi:hypothetical protein
MENNKMTDVKKLDLTNVSFPHAQIHEGFLLRDGDYEMAVDKYESFVNKDGDKGGVKIFYKVTAPQECAGQPFTEIFMLGDINSRGTLTIDANAWGSKFFKSTYKAANVPDNASLPAILATLQGNRFMLGVSLVTVKDGDRKGQEQNNVVYRGKLGSRVPQLKAAGAGHATAATPSVLPAPPPTAAAPPTYMPPPITPTTPAPPTAGGELVCGKCGKGYSMSQIAEYSQHVATCPGVPSGV